MEKEEYYLCFQAGGYFLAVSLDQILQVREISGDEEDVFDLSKYLSGRESEGNYLLEINVGGEKRNILVEKIEPIRDFNLAIWLNFPEIMRNEKNRVIKGFFFDGMRIFSLIDFNQFDFNSKN